MTITIANPATLYLPQGYAHAVVAEGSRVVFVGGQVASDLDGQVVHTGDYEAQAELTMRNFAAAVAASGATISDVAQLSIYVVDNSPERQEQVYAGFGRASAELGLRRTAMKILGVQALGDPQALVELDGVAIF